MYKDFKRYSILNYCGIVVSVLGKGIRRRTFFIGIEYNRNVYYGNNNYG